jgi:hypothetical protein
MSRHTFARTGVSRFFDAAAAVAALLQLSSAAPALAQQVTMETLLDRIQIEDLLVKYYYDLASGRAHEMSEYFTEDALRDVDGTIANGRAEIEDTELVKVDGKWLISKRYISSDSGLPDRFDQTFEQRDNPLPPL